MSVDAVGGGLRRARWTLALAALGTSAMLVPMVEARAGFANAGDAVETTIYLVATTTTTGGHLSLTPPPADGPSEYQLIPAGQTEGQLRTEGGIPFGVFFNLSDPRPLQFAFAVKVPASPSATDPNLDIRAYFGDHLLYRTTWARSPDRTSGWVTVQLTPARPEWAELAPGTDLRIVFRLLSGTDLTLGIGAGHETSFKMRHFTENPYAFDPIFIERVPGPNQGKVFRGSSAGASAGDAAEGTTWLLGAGLLVLAPMGIRGRRAAALAVVLLALSGCSGRTSKDDGTIEAGSDAPPPVKIQEERQTNETLRETNRGAVRGFITDADRFNIPLPGVRVGLEDTTAQATSGDDGGYLLDRLVPFQYRVVFTPPQDFQPTFRDVTVEAGVITWLNVTFARPSLDPSEVAHRHDEAWRAKTEMTLFEGTVPIGTSGTGGTVCALWPVPSCFAHGPLFTLEGERRVEPGTGRLVVTISGGAPTAEYSIGALAPRPESRATADFIDFSVRPGGEATVIPILPGETDPGHQLYTDWQFQVSARPRAGVWTEADVSVKIVAQRGVISYESPHPDPWGSLTNRTVVDAKRPNVGVYIGQNPTELTNRARAENEYYFEACWPAAGPVPAGAARVAGNLWYSTQDTVPGAIYGIAGHYQYGFAWRPRPTEAWHFATATEMQATNATGFHIDLPVKAGDADGPYSRPAWEFCLTSKRPQDDDQAQRFERYYDAFLRLEAIKGP